MNKLILLKMKTLLNNVIVDENLFKNLADSTAVVCLPDAIVTIKREPCVMCHRLDYARQKLHVDHDTCHKLDYTRQKLHVDLDTCHKLDFMKRESHLDIDTCHKLMFFHRLHLTARDEALKTKTAAIVRRRGSDLALRRSFGAEVPSNADICIRGNDVNPGQHVNGRSKVVLRVCCIGDRCADADADESTKTYAGVESNATSKQVDGGLKIENSWRSKLAVLNGRADRDRSVELCSMDVSSTAFRTYVARQRLFDVVRDGEVLEASHEVYCRWPPVDDGPKLRPRQENFPVFFRGAPTTTRSSSCAHLYKFSRAERARFVRQFDANRKLLRRMKPCCVRLIRLSTRTILTYVRRRGAVALAPSRPQTIKMAGRARRRNAVVPSGRRTTCRDGSRLSATDRVRLPRISLKRCDGIGPDDTTKTETRFVPAVSLERCDAASTFDVRKRREISTGGGGGAALLMIPLRRCDDSHARSRSVDSSPMVPFARISLDRCDGAVRCRNGFRRLVRRTGMPSSCHDVGDEESKTRVIVVGPNPRVLLFKDLATAAVPSFGADNRSTQKKINGYNTPTSDFLRRFCKRLRDKASSCASSAGDDPYVLSSPSDARHGNKSCRRVTDECSVSLTDCSPVKSRTADR